GILLSKDATADAAEILRDGADFYRPAHATIYDAITALDGRGEPADPITVAAEPGHRGDLARLDCPAYLHQLIEATPTPANAGYYAAIVADRAKLRRLLEAGTRITALGHTTDGDADDLLDAAGAALHAAVSTRGLQFHRRDPPGGLGRTVGPPPVPRRHPRVPTGLTDLDALAKGLRPGHLDEAAFADDEARSPADKGVAGRALRRLPGQRLRLSLGGGILFEVLDPERLDQEALEVVKSVEQELAHRAVAAYQERVGGR
ncbi:DnaB-like helicase N-terminal domain-containing protein, partial [Streptomyces sp. HB2AG]|uniref:DnaB-like helicase N-terminal domain-containing protein n=1 Tax=Streptomyces sp. HB2AG TaxID=2983400 RepID=UPI0022BFD2BB